MTRRLIVASTFTDDPARVGLDVTDFDAVGDGITDDSAAIQRAIDAAESAVVNDQVGQTVFFPPGRYLITTGLTIQEGFILLEGAGWDTTRLIFAPTLNNQVLVNFDRGAAGVLFFNGIRDMRLVSSADTGLTKTALRTKDVSNFLVENFIIGAWTGNDDSVGWEIRGRDFYSVRNIHFLNPNRPMRIRENDQNPINDLDHCAIRDMTILQQSVADRPCIEIDDGIILQEVLFDGFQSWVKGSHGLLWNDSSSAQLSTGLHLRNVRTEQGTLASAFTARVDKTGGAQLEHFSYINGLFDTMRNGVFLRNVRRAAVKEITYGGTGDIFDIDGCFDFHHENLLTNALASLSMGAGMINKMSMGVNQDANAPIAETGWWSEPAVNSQLPTRLFDTRIWAQRVTIANGATFSLAPIGTGLGNLIADIRIHASGTTLDSFGEVLDSVASGFTIKNSSANFSIVLGTPVSLNLVSGAVHSLQNLLGESVDVIIWIQWDTGTL